MKADIIFKGNAIFDSVSNEPFEGFVAIKGNKIIAVENSDDCCDYEGLETQVIECGDKLVMPGMIDAHMHFFDGIFQSSKFMCRDMFECKSARECVDAIAKFAKEHPDYERVVGMGWFPPVWDDPTPPNKQMLDEIESERPVYMMCADGHSFWLNSKAMEECEIDPNRKLLFGEIEVDENGEANGVLHELDACGPPAVNAQKIPDDERKPLIESFVRELNSKGFTGTSDMAILPNPTPITDDVKVTAELEAEGKLNIRLNLYPSLGITEDFDIVEEYRNKFNSDKLRVAGLKSFVDGVHGNHTALTIDPYIDVPGDHKGESFYSHEYYMKRVEAANRLGYGVKLHCCGEGAVHWALDAYEGSHKAGADKGVRNSIEHVETFRIEEMDRFRECDVTATMQPLHYMYQGSGMLKSMLGEDRARYSYALRTMLDNGVNVAFSSDYPVAEYDPMVNIYFSTTRCNPDGSPAEENPKELITLAEALKAYTIGSAYCVNMDDKVGTLEAGKLADVVVLDKNLFNAPASEILETNVSMTMVDGILFSY